MSNYKVKMLLTDVFLLLFLAISLFSFGASTSEILLSEILYFVIQIYYNNLK